MTRKFFGDGEHDFALPSKWILELEKNTGAGFGELLHRLVAGNFRLADISETIRLSLIGGGMSAQQAFALVNTYVATEGNPLIEAHILATEILTTIHVGEARNEPA